MLQFDEIYVEILQQNLTALKCYVRIAVWFSGAISPRDKNN